MITAKVIADSISVAGKRITTLELFYPKFIHSEFMTHRVFSRNASSSRAIPVARLIKDVYEYPVIPIGLGQNKPGMQAGEGFTKEQTNEILLDWNIARDNAVRVAHSLAIMDVHKQHVNRLLEPFSHIRVCVTATEWDNFFALRIHPDAQPEMRALAEAMHDAMADNTPETIKAGWHLPYMTYNDIQASGIDAALISAARCARVSYNLHDGKPSTLEADKALALQLFKDKHMSPFEHQAAPARVASLSFYNLNGWISQRYHIDKYDGYLT